VIETCRREACQLISIELSCATAHLAPGDSFTPLYIMPRVLLPVEERRAAFLDMRQLVPHHAEERELVVWCATESRTGLLNWNTLWPLARRGVAAVQTTRA
jgi:hypothetical protein